MTPYHHAESSAKKFSGVPVDYLAIHEWFDETKQYTGDYTHRAMRHHAAGIEECTKLFGSTITNSDGKIIPVKLIAEQHVTEDCGFIPTIQDWLKPILQNPEKWMLRVAKKATTGVKIKKEEDNGEDAESDRKPVSNSK